MQVSIIIRQQRYVPQILSPLHNFRNKLHHLHTIKKPLEIQGVCKSQKSLIILIPSVILRMSDTSSNSALVFVPVSENSHM